MSQILLKFEIIIFYMYKLLLLLKLLNKYVIKQYFHLSGSKGAKTYISMILMPYITAEIMIVGPDSLGGKKYLRLIAERQEWLQGLHSWPLKSINLIIT